ncbi:MAG: hypothetical protein L3J79_09830, partial [Candidatus Marinimicrobia bacterium]|nr:hypothetical protein [Candidatus Neomarinimicrobiota bacterium]
MTLFKTINAPVLILVAGLFMAAPHAVGYTSPIEGGVTETVTNTWVVPDGDLYVGQTTPNNALILSNGDIYNTHGFIGSHAGSSNNTVLLTGSRSIWHNTEGLYLGGHKDGTNWVNGGSGNTLDVFDGWVFVGEMDANIDYNLSESIAVGDASGTPEMVIANGSTVRSSGDSYIGYGTNESGSVEIRGEGSVWEAGHAGSTSYFLYIGRKGSGNKLTISDGGLLDAGVLIGDGPSADNNMVLVTGEGSRLEGYVEIGSFGSGNRLEVSDGGLVHVERAILGLWNGSDDNSVLVTGTGSAWETVSNFGGFIVVGS